MLTAVLIIVALAAGMYVLTARYPKTAELWFRRIWTARLVLFGVFWLSFGLVALGSGVFPLMLLGVVIYAMAIGYVIFEEPQQMVKSWIR